jgi:inactivated superfamily I helicase
LFEPCQTPRVFAIPPGVDFPKALKDGLQARTADQPPEALARVQLIVNTARMERRLTALFNEGPATLPPRVSLLTQLDALDPAVALPPAVSPLRRRLELIALVAQLLEQDSELVPRSALYALTDSLAALMDEMQGEGVEAEAIRSLDVSDQ